MMVFAGRNGIGNSLGKAMVKKGWEQGVSGSGYVQVLRSDSGNGLLKYQPKEKGLCPGPQSLPSWS